MNNIIEFLRGSRMKSFYWRTSMMALAVVIGEASALIVSLDFPVWVTGILGLGLGEVSKYINNQLR
jgi:hypothetical protein